MKNSRASLEPTMKTKTLRDQIAEGVYQAFNLIGTVATGLSAMWFLYEILR